MSGVNAAITDHFVMFFRDMLYEPRDKFHNRDGFFYICVVFVPVVVEGNGAAVILIDPGGGNHRASKITANVFQDRTGVTCVRPGVDIEAIFVLLVAAGFYFFKRGTDPVFQLVKQDSTEGVAEIGIVEMPDVAPETVVTVTTFGNEAVDMWVPFQVPAEGVENKDNAGCEIHGFVLFKKHV